MPNGGFYTSSIINCYSLCGTKARLIGMGSGPRRINAAPLHQFHLARCSTQRPTSPACPALAAPQPDVRVVSASYGGPGYSSVRSRTSLCSRFDPASWRGVVAASLVDGKHALQVAGAAQATLLALHPAPARQIEESAIRQLGQKNVLMVAAAGNEAANATLYPSYPAR